MKKSNNYLFFVSCAIYCLAAMFINCFGQASPSMMECLSILQSKQGAILTYEAIGGIIIAIYLSFYGENLNKVKTIIVGSLSLAFGSILVYLFSYTSNPYSYIFIALILANIGYTTIDLTMNSMISEVYADNKNKYMPIIHTFYGLGAMAMPSFYLIVTSFVNKNHYAYAYLALGLLVLIASFILIKVANISTTSAKTEKTINDPFEIFKTTKAWLLLLSALLFAIFQTGFQSWISDYNLTARNLPTSFSSIIITAFFAGSLIMRMLSTSLLNKIKNYNYYLICALLSGLSLLIATLANNTTMYAIFLILAGVFQGGLVPTFMIIATDAFPTRQSSSSSIFILAIGISNLLSKFYGQIIETCSHSTLMIILGCSLMLSGIIIRLINKRK